MCVDVRRGFTIESCILAACVLVTLARPTLAASNTWADPKKTLRTAFEVDVTGFDPAGTQDIYSNTIEARIFDALYEWDYLARPYRLEPSVAAAMPAYSDDGKKWTIRIKRGIYFADDPAFNGKKRELTAADVAYSWKRLVDPRVRSPNADFVSGKLAGLDEAAKKAAAAGRFDYDTDIEGIRAVDRYTLELNLTEPDYTLLSYFTSPALRIVAREVIEKYADASGRAMDHPVGSNAYRLKSWIRGQKVVLEANPNYREVYFPEAPGDADAATKALASAMEGKRLPQIGVIDVSIVEEAQPRLLLFDQGALDIVNVPRELAPRVFDSQNRLLPVYAKRNVDLQQATELAVAYTYFNMDDPVVGGYTAEKIALRRAMCSAYRIDDEIRVIRQGQAMPATQPIPPDVAGHTRNYNKFGRYDPAEARALLDKFGYRDRDGDGFREEPDGRTLVLRFASEPDQTSRQYDELWQRSLTAVGLKVVFEKQKWPELYKASRAGQLQAWSLGTLGDITDYYMLQFYGPSAGVSNLSRFRNADFDALFLQSRRTRDDVDRTRIYAKMTDIIAAHGPWCPHAFRIGSTVAAPWVQGHKKNVHYFYPPWRYLDIDLKRLRSD